MSCDPEIVERRTSKSAHHVRKDSPLSGFQPPAMISNTLSAFLPKTERIDSSGFNVSQKVVEDTHTSLERSRL